jgi:hypothetical protein
MCCRNCREGIFARRSGRTKGRYLNLKSVLRQGCSRSRAIELLRHADGAPEVDQQQADPHQQDEGHERYVAVEDELGRNEAGSLHQRLGALLEQLVDEVLLAVGAGEHPHRRAPGKQVQRDLHQREQYGYQREFDGHGRRYL